MADGFDLALHFGEPPVGSFVAHKLTETRVIIVASPAYLKRHTKPRLPKEVEKHDCIDFYDAANGRPYEWEVRKKKDLMPLRGKGRLLVSDSGTLLSACEGRDSRTFYLYNYKFNLNDAKTVHSIQLLNNANVQIMAMTLVQ